MSDTTASLRRKIGGAGDLQSVVRTMKAIVEAASCRFDAARSRIYIGETVSCC